MVRRELLPLVLALGLHMGVLALGRRLPERLLGPRPAPTSEVEVELVPTPPADTAPAEPQPTELGAVAAAAAGPRLARAVLPKGGGDATSTLPEGSGEDEAPAAGVGSGTPAPGPAPEKPVNLGLGGDIAWMYRGRAPEVQKPRRRHQSVGALTEGLEARDRAHGLTRGGVVATVAHGVALRVGPTKGRATFVVDTDPSGRVRSVVTAGVNGDRELWERVARALLAALRAKQLRVPPGAAGLRVTVLVSVYSVVICEP